MTGTAVIDRITAPLDRVRREVFRHGMRVPVLRTALLHRESRLALLASVHVLLALAVAACFPVFAFLLGPIIFGAAHVAADVRYLVVRRSYAAWWRYVILTACVTLTGLRIYSIVTHNPVHQAEVLTVAAWAIVGVLAARRNALGRFSKRAVCAVGIVVLCAAACLRWPFRSELVLLHGHNLVALVAWLTLFGSRTRVPWLVVVLAILGSAALLDGLWAPQLSALGARFQGLHVLQVSEWVAPGLALQPALGLTSVYLFLQSVHYATWLYHIPQNELPREAPATFRASAHGFARDFGRLGSIVVVFSIVAVLLSCLVWNVQLVRHTYVALASFHVYLELVLLLHLWTRERAPATEAARTRARGPNAPPLATAVV